MEILILQNYGNTKSVNRTIYNVNGYNRVSTWMTGYKGKAFPPGSVRAPGGYYHGIHYLTEQNNEFFSKGYEQMGGRGTNGCTRLYWQDLKWIYENCPVGTISKSILTTKAFEPFGACEKINRNSNKTQERAHYTLQVKYEENAKKVDCYIPYNK